ncbi:hypothetical protein BT93_H1319 [Corymbia citriodora subsp. variegata]|nr:hypothetical protein BT93_H1319 [Corymbia citriodora subsp. variegata]
MALQRYYLAIRAHADMQPKLEENNLKLLHIKQDLRGWREWSVWTYDHNVIGEIIIKENKLLQKKINDHEKKLKMLTSPPTYGGWPLLNRDLSAKSSGEPEKET